MNLDSLVEFVDDMIVQNDYPGFEPRALKIGLPESFNKSGAKIFGQALKHENLYVRLAALRWFQEKPGLMRPYFRVITDFLGDADSFIRQESILCFERCGSCNEETVIKISRLLGDSDVDVRKAAAKACGKIASKLKIKDGEVVEALRQAASEGDSQVRFKAEKALRKIGVYD